MHCLTHDQTRARALRVIQRVASVRRVGARRGAAAGEGRHEDAVGQAKLAKLQGSKQGVLHIILRVLSVFTQSLLLTL